jgi:hypothetical protein
MASEQSKLKGSTGNAGKEQVDIPYQHLKDGMRLLTDKLRRSLARAKIRLKFPPLKPQLESEVCSKLTKRQRSVAYATREAQPIGVGTPESIVGLASLNAPSPNI